MCSFDVWDFYLSENLETGSAYDLDIALVEHEEHINDAELKQRNKSISAIYEDLFLSLPDIFNQIVYEINQILQQSTADSWKTIWDKVERIQVNIRPFVSY